MKKKTLFIEITSFLFIILFIYAAGSKLVDYQKFTVQLGQSPMLTRWANLITWLIPIIEIIVAIMFSFKKTQKIALYGALNLMTVFTTYIIIVTNFSSYVPCSCGGVLEKLGWTEHLIFNIIFITLAAIAILTDDSSPNEYSQSQKIRSQSLKTKYT